MGIRAFGRLFTGGAATVALAIGLAMVVQLPARADNGDDAMAILKTMSGYIDSQQSIALLYDSDVEVITPQLQKLQFTSSGQVLLDRPNKLHVTRHGGYADVDVYFDGKRATIYGNNVNAFASQDVQGTIDQLIDKLRGDLGIDAPGADLLFSRSFEGMTTDVMEARHIGRGVVDGVECEHLAFRNTDTDGKSGLKSGQSRSRISMSSPARRWLVLRNTRCGYRVGSRTRSLLPTRLRSSRLRVPSRSI
jgi:hypothetical protein